MDNRATRNRLRSIVMKGEESDLISKEEAGFVVTLIERFRGEIDKKIKVLHQIQGEIAQLKTNEEIVISTVENMIKAAERDKARQETMRKLKEARLVEEERHRERKEKLEKEKAKAPAEQADFVEDN